MRTTASTPAVQGRTRFHLQYLPGLVPAATICPWFRRCRKPSASWATPWTARQKVEDTGMEFKRAWPILLASEHRHTVFTRQRTDHFLEGDIASMESARQYKDATDLVCTFLYQDTIGALTTSDYKGPNSQYVHRDKLVIAGPKLIRRLTPTECERLQGLCAGCDYGKQSSKALQFRQFTI